MTALAAAGLAAGSRGAEREEAQATKATEAQGATRQRPEAATDVPPATPAAGPQVVTPPGSPQEQDAAARMAAFLEHVVLTSPSPVPDSLMSCEWRTDSVLSLATFRVLSAVLRGDTVRTAAEILTVAEEHAEPDVADRYVATLRVRRDTLHWRMTRHPEFGGWGVCGYSVEGWGFIRHGYDTPGPWRRWKPPGASYARARALVDSIRRRR